MLIYDIEIRKAILGKHDTPLEGVEYCEGWGDHENMGISCVCCYDYITDRYRVFCEDNMPDFGLLVENHEVIVGFNNIGFDNKVLACQSINPPERSIEYLDSKSYDILAEIRKAGGGWCGLDAMVKANSLATGKTGKTGNGAMAPMWYQAGRIGKLVDYCMADVWLTKKLLDKIIKGQPLISSKTGQVINVRKP